MIGDLPPSSSMYGSPPNSTQAGTRSGELSGIGRVGGLSKSSAQAAVRWLVRRNCSPLARKMLQLSVLHVRSPWRILHAASVFAAVNDRSSWITGNPSVSSNGRFADDLRLVESRQPGRVRCRCTSVAASQAAERAFTEPFQTVCDRQASDEFYVLVADCREAACEAVHRGLLEADRHSCHNREMSADAEHRPYHAVPRIGSIETYTTYLACGWTPTRCKT